MCLKSGVGVRWYSGRNGIAINTKFRGYIFPEMLSKGSKTHISLQSLFKFDSVTY